MFAHMSPKERLGYAALATVLLFFAGYVGARHLKRPAPIVVEGDVSGAPTVPPGDVLVDVAGAVVRPGVVRLPSGSRVKDAIDRAGGEVAEADLSRLNLAARLVDGSQLIVPIAGERGPPVAAAYLGGGSSTYEKEDSPDASPTPSASGGISLSSASAKELEGVPGIGPATSARILEYRSAHGGFRSVDELMAVKGIGPKKLEQLRRYLRP